MNEVEFAKAWEEGWNSHDLDVIMSHYRDDIVFRSLKAAALVGQGEVVGKAALRSYWAAALERQPDLRFRVQEVFAGYQMLVISYLNHRDILATETLYYDDNGIVYQAAACHRVANE
jgi:ketosteroid isomerase-like protein